MLYIYIHLRIYVNCNIFEEQVIQNTKIAYYKFAFPFILISRIDPPKRIFQQPVQKRIKGEEKDTRLDFL